MWKNSLINKIFKFNQLFFFWYYLFCIFSWLNGMHIYPTSQHKTNNKIISNIKTWYRSCTSCKPSDEWKSARNNNYFTLMFFPSLRSLTSSPLLICHVVGDLRKHMYGSADSDFTSWIYNDILNKVMTISDNRIAHSAPSRLVKRSYSRNNLFHWMVCMVLGPA